MTIQSRGVMRTVNPTDRYRKKDFVNAMNDLSLLEQIAQNINTPEGNFDPNLRQDASVLLEDRPDFYTELSPDVVVSRVQSEYKIYNREMQNYTITNFNSLLDKVGGQSLLQFVISLPIAKIGNKRLDKVVDAINEKRKIAEVVEKGGEKEYVMEKLSHASAERRANFFEYLVGSQGYIEKTFESYAQEAEFNFNNAVSDGEGNINASVLRGVVKHNYNQFVDKDTESKDRVTGMYLSAIAKGAYLSVKSDKKGRQGSIARTSKVTR